MHCELNRTHRRFTAYGQKEPLNCNDYSNATIKASDKTINTKVYVIAGNEESLLGRDSSFKLAILTQVNSVGHTSDQMSWIVCSRSTMMFSKV